MKDYILARLKEPSTWRGIVLAITAFGVSLSPEQVESIITVGLLLTGILGIGTSDK